MKIQSALFLFFISLTRLYGQSIDGVYSGNLGTKCAFKLTVINGSATGLAWFSESFQSSFIGKYDGKKLNGTIYMPGADQGYELTGEYRHDSLRVSFFLVRMNDTLRIKGILVKVSNDPNFDPRLALPKASQERDERLIGTWVLLKNYNPAGVDITRGHSEIEFYANGDFKYLNVPPSQVLIENKYSTSGTQLTYSITSKLMGTLDAPVTYEIHDDTLKTISMNGTRSIFFKVRK